MKILVSKCLLGENCRYKGDNCKSDKVLAYLEGHEIIPICPEQAGGLPTPRDPGERVGNKVISNKGKDITAEYQKGAEIALKLAQDNKVDLVIFKAKSPSCGKGLIYDGTFTGNKIPGNGVAAELLLANGFKVITDEEI